MTRDQWVARHPYLQPVAELQALVATNADRIGIPLAVVPDWNGYGDDYRAGLPVLKSPYAAIDVDALHDAIVQLVRGVGSASPSTSFVEQCHDVESDITSGAPVRHPGLLRFFAWAILSRHLSPVASAFSQWRDEERWLRNYCPLCGEPPAMAHLAGLDPGRLRLLCCGCCGTRWRYRRTACPFCDDQHEHRLTALNIEGEDGLRIDYCESCRGYLKTYAGQGDESLLLADWTSLHLDLLAGERGLKRMATSLYTL